MTTRLRDIAERVGVSTASVSLVLNGHAHGRVNPALAQLIHQTAEEMGYLPNLVARSLKTRQSKTFGVLAEGVASIPFSGRMLAGAHEVAWKSGYLLVVIDIGRDEDLVHPGIRSLIQRDVQALILATDYHRSIAVPSTGLSIPRVLLDASPAHGAAQDEDGPVDWVVPAELEGAQQAVDHLLDFGHRRVAWCGVPPGEYIASELRFEGYLRALEARGVPFDPALAVTAPGPETLDGRPVAEQLLTQEDGPTAVFCFSDRLAMAFYQVAARHGLRVPEDLSIVGFDDTQEVAAALLPGLTTVQLPHRQMGAWAAKAALRRVTGAATSPPTGERIACPLILRDSVAAPSQ